MDTPAAPDNDSALEREVLLREGVEVLLGELDVLAERRWSDLPELKKRKVVLASRLSRLPPDRVSPPTDKLQSVLVGLEAQVRRQMSTVIERTGRQIAVLQEVRQFCTECASVSFRKFC